MYTEILFIYFLLTNNNNIFFLFFYFLIQYCYLLLYNYFNITQLETYNFDYKKDDSLQTAIIYKLNERKNKIILCVSGAYSLEMHPYILKVMNDLKNNSKITQTYQLLCFENKKVPSLIIYDDVASFIRQLDTEMKLEELILIGFSSGGVVSSHIMYRLNDLKHFNKKIITYDTPWQIHDNVISFSSNLLYRIDIIFYSKVYSTYSNYYSVDKIKQFLQNNNWFNGSKEIIEIIRNVHSYNEEQIMYETGFNLGIDEKVIVINLFNKYDPIVYRPSHNAHYQRIKNKIKFPVFFIEKNAIGHCSDMCFSTIYLESLISAIEYVHPN